MDDRPTTPYETFAQLDIRVGQICQAEPFAAARKPAYQLQIDFGPLGIKKSSAQITQRYTPEQLVGRRVVAVVNFPPRQIANFMSEVLVLGVVPEAGDVVLLTPDAEVPLGSRVL
ncbi:MAG: tRNA-binding protein [Cyanobacteria bacterium P01_G01_bin.54]